MTAIIFDLDDTLYKEHDYVLSGFKAVATTLSNEFRYLDVEELYDKLVLVWKRSGRGKVFDIVCNHYKVETDISRLVHIYRHHEPLIELYPDAIKFLAWLKKGNFKTGIITDGTAVTQWRKIDALRLRKKINVIVVTDDLGRDCWKPSEIPYLKAAELLETSITDCVYIGDNPHKDFITAKKLGMKTVRVIRPIGDHMQTRLTDEFEADVEVSLLTDLIPMLS